MKDTPVTDHPVGATETGARKRLASELRRDQLLDAAARLVVEQGFLPLAMERLARGANVSKALIYAYYPTQYELLNALLTREVDALAAAGLDSASHGKVLEAVTLDCVMLYFDHVVRWGPLLHILLSDRFLMGHLDREAVRKRDRIVRRIARLARRSMRLPPKEVLAGINLILAIPEEAGALAFHRELDVAIARDLCRTLTLSGLEGLKSCEREATPEWGF